MEFGPEASRFLKLDAERLILLASMCAARSLPYHVIKTGRARHLLVKVGKGRPRLVLAAHYDRAPGSPGVLDNSCACLQLLELAARLGSGAAMGGEAALVIFTDAEELLGSGAVESQGAYGLAAALRAVRRGRGRGDPSPLPVLVLDVTGRGDQLLISSAPRELLRRGELGDSSLAAGHEALVGLALRGASRARLAQPMSLRLPWSDDLGLILGGVPALAVSLLPRAEAEAYREGLGLLPVSGPPDREGLGLAWPPSWARLHGPGDSEELAEGSSFELMSRFLEAVLLGP